MAGPAQKTQEAISQAKVEFTTDFVIANPRNGVYAVNAGSGFLRITLPKEKNDELLALRRSNPASAQAWLDSTVESVRRQYEKANSANFTFTLTPLGEITVPKAEAVADTSRLPSKIAKAPIPVPKPEVVADTAAARKEAEEKAHEASIREIQKAIPEFRGGSGTGDDPYLLSFTDKGEKKGLGATSIIIPFTFADTYQVQAEVTLSQLAFGGAIKDTYGAILAVSRSLIKRTDGAVVSTKANLDDFQKSVEQNLRKMNLKALEYVQTH